MYIIPGNSKFRIVWDLIIGILVVASCILIPYQVAFQHQVIELGTEILYLIDLFFLLDILFNFLTTFRREGMEIRDRKLIAHRYLTTYFFIDILANFPWDFFLLIIGDFQVASVSLVLIFRLFRLLRLMRLLRVFQSLEIQSWSNTGYLRIIKFLTIIILVAHWVACAWFFLPFLDKFPPNSWVAIAGLENAEPGTQYIRSLYWAVTTMTTVGYGDITPNRDVEYVLSIIVMILGASLYAFVIGNIASLLSNLDAAKVGFWGRIEALNQYLRAQNVPTEVNEYIQKYYEYLWERHRGLKENNIFEDLPEPMRLELLQHVIHEFVEKVPLFKYSSVPLRNALLMALKPQTYPPNGYVALEGETGKNIFFISRGKMEILSNKGKERHGFLEAGEYFGDLSLILEEKRTASVKALTYCEVFILTREDFTEIKKEYLEFTEVLKKTSSEKTEKVEALLLEGIIL